LYLTSRPITQGTKLKTIRTNSLARVQRAQSPLVVLLGKKGAWGKKTRFIEKNGFSSPKKKRGSPRGALPLDLR